MFKPEDFIQKKIERIKEVVGQERALVATSGGVDSSTCAVLAARALGKNLRIVFLDDGLMREGEGERTKRIFKRSGLDLQIKKVAKSFFKALKGIEDPEKKRKVFREVFYKTLGKIAGEEMAKFLIQGTIKADIVETKGGIKTQHNVLEQIGIDPKNYGFSVIEPLKNLYKPEVRKVAKVLGLPKEIWNRMPFPGPGLALRVIGEVTPERIEIVRRVHLIVEKELKAFSPFQAFAVLLKDKATGIKNKKRAFGNIIAIRAVDSGDAMTATVTKIPWEGLQKIQKRITSKIPSVVKIVFDITPKPPSTIEYL